VSGFIDGGAAHSVGSFCSFFVALLGIGAAATVVCLAVATRPTVVLRFSGCIGGRSLVGCMQFGDFEQGIDKFAVDRGELGGQGTVGGTESCDRLAVMRGGSGQVGNSVDSVLLVDGIGSLVASSGRSDVGFAEFTMTESEVTFEVVPSFISLRLSFPNLAVIEEHAGGKD
jgi:hypothetical protein